MNEKEAMEVFDGLMLGDGGLISKRTSAYFNVDLSAGDPVPWVGKEYKVPQYQYLVYIKECLESLGIEFGLDQPKKPHVEWSHGNPYLCCELRSLSSKFLLAQFRRWYGLITPEIRRARGFAPNQRWYKFLPDDIKLTPLTVAKWFEGDGSTSAPTPNSVHLSFAAAGFSYEEDQRLCGLFLVLGIQAKVHRSQLGKYGVVLWRISVGAIGNVNAFFNLTELFIHYCYKYKIYRPKHASECITIEEIDAKGRYNDYKRNYREKHKEHINKYMKSYREEHEEQFKEYTKNRHRKRMAMAEADSVLAVQSTQAFSSMRLKLGAYDNNT